MGQLHYPIGLALSLRGAESQGGDYLLYVCENSNNRIQVLNARTGAHVCYLGEGQVSYPYGLKLYPGAEM